MNNTLILTGAAAFFIGALFAWLITRYQAQSRHFIVLQELAESRRLHEFAEQVQAQTAADLAQSRHTVQELQDELQETGNRFAAAEKQIAYLQDCEAEAEALKHECAKWQQSAQNLQINNERLNTQLAQEQALSADKKYAFATTRNGKRPSETRLRHAFGAKPCAASPKRAPQHPIGKRPSGCRRKIGSIGRCASKPERPVPKPRQTLF